MNERVTDYNADLIVSIYLEFKKNFSIWNKYIYYSTCLLLKH